MATTKARAQPSIDTNVLLRLIVRDHEAMFERARIKLAHYEQVHVADQAVVEVVYVLGGHYGYSRSQICDVIRELIANQHLIMNRNLFEAVLALYEKHTAVSFTDVCLSIYAKLTNATPLLTFDKKLARQIPHVDEIA